MAAIVRTVVICFGLLVPFRLSGKRTLKETTNFDFVLFLVIGEATQQALLGNDFSLTNGLIVIATLLLLDIGFSILKQRSPMVAAWVEGEPLIILQNGRPLRDRMDRARVDEEDILEAARELQGLERLDQIRYAVLERNGTITIIPAES